LFLLWLLAGTAAAASETFPEPPELKPDIDFWVQIFTHYNTRQGVLHDSRDLSVVYEHLEFAPGDSSRARQRKISNRREALQTILRRLASGKRTGLNDAEATILALWPDEVSNTRLAQAAKDIRYQQGLQDRFREGLVRAGLWRTYINEEFALLGVPIEMAALPHVESSYNPAARSSVGASGIWQFTRSTGRRFMRVDHVLDERNDPFAATRAAGKLLAYNYSITGNWPMAITAYNHGLGGVRRAMQEYGDTAYVDILRKYHGRTFGFASRNFYVAFLAAKQVDQDVERYFPGLVPANPLNFATADLQAFVALDDLAAGLGITSRQLAESNPALQATVITGSKHLPKGFSVRVPSTLLAAPLDKLVANIPASSWYAEQLPDLFHTVARGDTLSQIAETYRTRVSTLVALNSLKSSNSIRIGQQIRLPAAGPAPAIVASAPVEEAAPEPAAGAAEIAPEELPTISVLEGDFAAALRGTLQTALLSDPSDYSVGSDNSIEIHPLETLGHYADWLEIRTQRLRDINGLAFRTAVEVGDRIRLDFTTVNIETFEERRIEFHRRQQDAFFREHVITGFTEHVVRAGESVWILSLRQYDVPIWLFRQYNPELDLDKIRPGILVRFPILSAAE
jgi:membrane-bound lytic murein transglycosylase D